jgi:hypothetical protein
MRLATLTAACLSLSLPALADEVWSTPYGNIVYERDLDGYIAVLSVPAEAMTGDATTGATPATVHVMGMTPVAEERSGLYEGFWYIQGNTGYCEAQMTAPGGKATNNWGRVRIYFDRPAFPTGFLMLVGSCFYDPYFVVRADPAAG